MEIRHFMGGQYLEDLISLMPGHVYWKDKDGIYLGCNNLQARDVNLSIQDIIGKTDYDFPWKKYADEIRKNDIDVMESGVAKTFEEPSILADGTEIFFLSNKVPLQDKNGNIAGILGISFDITQRKQYEEELSDSRSRARIALKNILDNVPAHIFWKDRDSVLLGCNELQAKHMGFASPKEMIGLNNYEVTSKNQPAAARRAQAEAVTKIDLKVIKTGKPYVAEEPLVLPDGSEAIYLSKKAPLFNENREIIGTLGVSFDITDHKKTEKELEKLKEQLDKNNQAKAKFLRILQHDLRNKLTGILSFSDLLLDALDDKKQLKMGLSIINQAGKSIIPTLDRINHYLSLETGQLKPYYSLFELNPFLKSFEEKFKPALVAKGLSMEFIPDPKLDGHFMGDDLLMHDILDQLITNAIKYTDQGKITIETHVIRKKGANIWLDIVVRDTGRGMSQRVADNVFKLFDYDPNDESKKYTTPGINLSISKKIAELLEGDLMVDSQAGKGTDFTFYLKLKAAKSPEKRFPLKSPTMDFSLEEEDAEPAFNKEKFQVLVIEDDPTNQEALKALLSTYFRCDILSAMDLKTAKTLISNNLSIDLILTDIQLPDGEGQEIMPYLYQLHPSGDDLPWVVAVTAFAREVDIDYFCDQGIVSVISKPITLKELTGVICGLFGDKVIKKTHKS